MVELKNCNWKDFLSKLNCRPLYCFGCGELATWLAKGVCGQNISEYIVAFVDNDKRKEGTYICIDNKYIPVISYSEFVKTRAKDSVMLITSMYYSEILDQLDNERILAGMDCYIEVFLEEEMIKVSEKELRGSSIEQIPKIIHYCWFGKKEMPNVYKQYMETWKKYCPDYEIIRWDESNYDYTKTEYTKNAYDAGKWAFVSDYARLDIVYNNGGIYLDTDVEVVKNLDALLNNNMFCGFEKGNLINTGLGFGAIKGFEKLKRMRNIYHAISFKRENGLLNLTACTKYQTDYLMQEGLERDGSLQKINGIKILPRTVLSPFDFYGVSDLTSEATFTIHHYAATWLHQNNCKEKLVKRNDELRKRMNCHVEHSEGNIR